MKLRHVDGPAVAIVIFLFLVSLATAHAQIGGSAVQPVTGPSYSVPDHPMHASQGALRPETSLVGGGSVTTAQGERPMSDFPTYKVETPLGDVARQYRADHAKLTADDRAQIHWDQQ